jgi:hypothetical protein
VRTPNIIFLVNCFQLVIYKNIIYAILMESNYIKLQIYVEIWLLQLQIIGFPYVQCSWHILQAVCSNRPHDL